IKPVYSAFPVVGLPWEIIPFSTCEVARQSRNLAGTHIRLLEVTVKSRARISLTVKKPTAFLFFLLRGSIRFRDLHGQILSATKEPAYYFTYSPDGKAIAELDKGEHSLLVIGLDSDWFMPSMKESYPAFAPLLEMWSAKSKIPVLLPQKEITNGVWTTLAKVRNAVLQNMDDGLRVLNYISRCITFYHEQLVEKKEMNKGELLIKGKILKDHLSTIYMFDDECKVEIILEKLGWSDWTLRRITTEVLGCSIGQYVRKLRMEKAMELLLGTDMKIYDIAIKIGYSSPDSFAKAFKKLKGINPSAYRKKKH